ncbi:MAG: DUF72 domain-containing protein [Proteobacteria bacterium]|nr:DUF72 domain-containing protein [Pseudomonadota bacterium]
MARAGSVRIGVSGWRYPPWRSTFYPAGLVQRDELAYASRQLTTLEINGSFYSLQRAASWQAWHDATPAGFVFSVKGPKFITHVKRLRDVEGPLANFFASGIGRLGPKLGPILWQLPPNLAFDAPTLAAFLALLPMDTRAAARLARRHDERVDTPSLRFGDARPLRHALEARHPTFASPAVMHLLRRHGIAWVVADTGGRWPELQDVTASFVYVRLHGATELYRSRYDDAALAEWARRIAAWRGGGEVEGAVRVGAAPARRAARDVFCYFDNTDKVHAPDNARRLAALLGVGAPPDPAAPVPRQARAARATRSVSRRRKA